MLSAGGKIRSEVGWRVLPLLCGTLVVYLVWLTSAELSNGLVGSAVCAVAASSPTLVFYSQEARPLAVLTLSEDVEREPISELITGCRIVVQKSFSAPNGSFDLIKVKCPINIHFPLTGET